MTTSTNLPSFPQATFYPRVWAAPRFEWIRTYSVVALVGLSILLGIAYILYRYYQQKNPHSDQQLLARERSARVQAIVKEEMENLPAVYNVPSDIWIDSIFSEFYKPFVFYDLEGFPLRKMAAPELKKQLVTLALVCKTFNKMISLTERHMLPPNWKEITQGLNLQAKCLVNSCRAYDQFVYIPKGFGTFNIVQLSSTAECPECHHSIGNNATIELYFWNCTCGYNGTLTNNLGSFNEQKIIVFRDDFLKLQDTTNDPTLRGPQAQWTSLTITAEESNFS